MPSGKTKILIPMGSRLNLFFALKNTLFRVRRFWWRARRKDAVIARYSKALQRRYPLKDACYKGGLLERKKYKALLLSLSALSLFGCKPTAPEERMIPMPDRIQLQTRIWLPAGQGPFPVVFTRGYSAGSENDAQQFTRAGYVYVGQATRGHGSSQGKMNRFFGDAEDGYSSLTWISKQPWSNGKIAMYGKSYWGATQWLTAVKQHPNLKAIIPQNINADLWQCVYRCNGALSLAMSASGRAYSEDDHEKIAQYGWSRYFKHRPLLTLDELITPPTKTQDANLWKDYVTHAEFDDYWKKISLRGDGKDGKYQKINIPVYLMSGWYDYYAGAAFNSYQQLNKLANSQDLRITIDASSHLNEIVGERNFGKQAVKDELGLAIRWLDYVIKGENNEVKGELPIQYFTMGSNRWQAATEWPPAYTEPISYYLHAKHEQRRGKLKPIAPITEHPPIQYLYDPENPVPTLGGNHSFIDDAVAKIIRPGPLDQQILENRPDVLVFETDPLLRDTEVTGPVTMKLFAASSATDTDFVVRLIDKAPDGTSYNLTEGIMRARFHKSVWERPEAIEPNKVIEYNIALQPTSNLFKKGHRIAIHITSSSFPLWDPNTNTGSDQGTENQTIIASQSIYFDQRYPSHIKLHQVEH